MFTQRHEITSVALQRNFLSITCYLILLKIRNLINLGSIGLTSSISTVAAFHAVESVRTFEQKPFHIASCCNRLRYRNVIYALNEV